MLENLFAPPRPFWSCLSKKTDCIARNFPSFPLGSDSKCGQLHLALLLCIIYIFWHFLMPALPTPITCKSGGLGKKPRKTRRLGPQWTGDIKNMRQIKTSTTDYLFQRVLYLISALCCTLSCCTVTMSWHPKPWVSRSNCESWKVCNVYPTLVRKFLWALWSNVVTPQNDWKGCLQESMCTLF